MQKKQEFTYKRNNAYIYMLFWGLLFSETQLLINIPSKSSYRMNFVVVYLTIATLYLAYLIVQYAFFSFKKSREPLEFCQYFGISFSALLIKIIVQEQSLLFVKISSYCLLIVQSVLILLKIIYFGSVTKSFARVSLFMRLMRMFKLNLMVFLPLIISNPLAVKFSLGVCSIITAIIFCFKVTFQRIQMEHYLLLGVLCGLISNCEAVIGCIFDIRYWFIGEISFIVSWVIPTTVLMPLIQMKYRLLFFQKSELKTEENHLVDYLFLRECLYSQHRSLPLSQNIVNETVLKMTSLFTNSRTLEEIKLSKEVELIIESVKDKQKQFGKKFFTLVSQNFKNSQSFQCMEFLVDCSFDQKGRYINYGLIIFYHFSQKTQRNSSVLQRCRYKAVYSKIKQFFSFSSENAEQIKFVNFFQNLIKLEKTISLCFQEELRMIEQLSKNEQKNGVLTQKRLFERHYNKSEVRRALKDCIDSTLYIHCNGFKFLFLLYKVGIQKRFALLKKDIKRLFFSSQAIKIQNNFTSEPMVILNGFNSHKIINSNEAFQSIFHLGSHFRVNLNISELFPSICQANRHIELMKLSQQYVEKERQHSHEKCLIVVQRELQEIKFRTIQSFYISTRVYYESMHGFNYVCTLIFADKNQKKELTLLASEGKRLQKQGHQIVLKQTWERQQLDQVMDLENVEICFDKEPIIEKETFQQIKTQTTMERKKKGESYLVDKMDLIDKKLSLEQKYKTQAKINWIQLIVVSLIILSLIIILSYLWITVGYVTNIATTPSVSVGRVTLARRRVLLQKAILNFVEGTSMFPDNICINYGFVSLRKFMQAFINVDLTQSFKNLSAITYSFDPIFPGFRKRLFSSEFDMPNIPVQITYQKYINLFKAEMYRWLYYKESLLVNYTYYESFFTQSMLPQWTSEAESLYPPIDEYAHANLHNFSGQVHILKYLVLVLLTILMGVAIILRLKNTVPLVEYLNVVQNIQQPILNARIKQLKYCLQKLNELRNKNSCSERVQQYLQSIIKKGKRNKRQQQYTLNQFTNFQLNDLHKNPHQQTQTDFVQAEQQDSLLGSIEHLNHRKLVERPLCKVIIYNRFYLLLTLCFLSFFFFCFIKLSEIFTNYTQVISNYHGVSEEFNQIQKHSLNLLAYQWIKVVSLQHNINMTLPNEMYKEAIARLQTSNVTDMVKEVYPATFSKIILYGNICVFFWNKAHCQHYRNGIFTSGITVLLPLLIKQYMENQGMRGNYTHYLGQLCDKTTLILMGVIPLVVRIPMQAFEHIINQIDTIAPLFFFAILGSMGLLMALTLACLLINFSNSAKLREEVLSLDSVEHLYSIEGFKPYLNQIYYS